MRRIKPSAMAAASFHRQFGAGPLAPIHRCYSLAAPLASSTPRSPAAAPELASIDGQISPASDARIEATDDGLYRGDGVFEVIRLYDGQPVRPRSTTSTASSAPPRRSSCRVRPRSRSKRRSARCWREFGAGRRPAAADRHPRRPPDRRSPSRSRRTARRWRSPPSPTRPSVILDGVKSLSYAANMQATRIAKGKGADEALLVRPDGIVLEPPTSTIFWVSRRGRAAHARARQRRARVDHPRPDRQGARRRGGRAGRSTTCAAPSEAFLASTTREIQPVSAIDGPSGFRRARAAHRARRRRPSPRPSAVSCEEL